MNKKKKSDVDKEKEGLRKTALELLKKIANNRIKDRKEEENIDGATMAIRPGKGKNSK